MLISCAIWFYADPHTTVLAEDEALQQMRQHFISVNEHWNNREYQGVLNIIEARKQEDPNDVIALGLELYYYMLFVRDIAKAHQIADQLSEVLHESGHPELIRMSQSFVETVKEIPPEQLSPLTEDQMNVYHSITPNYPLIVEVFYMWAVLHGYIDVEHDPSETED